MGQLGHKYGAGSTGLNSLAVLFTCNFGSMTPKNTETDCHMLEVVCTGKGLDPCGMA